MLSSSDSTALTLWLNSQVSPHTRSCYRRYADRLLAHVGKSLNAIGLGDLQDFDESLIADGLAPVSRVRTLAAVKSLFSFCCRTRYLAANPATELTLPPYEQRLAERIVAERHPSTVLVLRLEVRDPPVRPTVKTPRFQPTPKKPTHAGRWLVPGFLA
jgi:site-specific recombinase XerD